MPGGFTFSRGSCNGIDYGTVIASARGTVITPSATANVKGSYIVLGTTTADISELLIGGRSIDVADQLVDLAIGSTGSEKIIASNLNWPTGTTISFSQYRLPLQIPAGTQLQCRAQASINSASGPAITIIGQDSDVGNMEGYSAVDDIGTNLAASTGTSFTTGNAVKGSYAILTPTGGTVRDYAGLILTLGGAAVTTDENVVLDLAIGPGGSEKVILPNYPFRWAAGFGGMFPNPQHILGTPIPAGTQIQIRAQSTAVVSSTAQLWGLYL